MAAGGDCIDDCERLRDDDALQELLGGPLPASETIRQALYEFHDESAVQSAREDAEQNDLRSYVPEESAPLKGLGRATLQVIEEAQRRWPSSEATIDIDATIEESHKQEAKPHYNGGRGYQPQLAVWVEQKLIVRDEFRDGNVPAHMGMLQFVKSVFASLPATATVRRCRGDTQLYSPPVLKFFAEQGIEFTIGARVKTPLREACGALPEEKWEHVADNGDTRVEVAFVDYRPRELSDMPGLRYIGIRMTPRQEDLLDGSRKVFHLAIASTRPGSAADVVRWYWGKAGTIEQVHDAVKNELGGGVPPCGRFGANAAWFRLATLTFNILSVIRRLGPPELRDARPKRLRFRLFNLPTTLIHHARRLVARVSRKFRDAVHTVPLRNALWQQPAAT
jgi:hypothetical protein